ncbi:MAG: hypothetical protein ABIO62_08390 [Paracoccaceae bacterium]
MIDLLYDGTDPNLDLNACTRGCPGSKPRDAANADPGIHTGCAADAHASIHPGRATDAYTCIHAARAPDADVGRDATAARRNTRANATQGNPLGQRGADATRK